MRFFLLLLVFCGGICPLLQAQQLTGRVVDAFTGQPLSYVTIVNVKSQVMEYSDKDGNFSIAAGPEDEVAFNLLGYQSQKLKGTQLASQEKVQLRRTTIGLSEVTVRPDWTPYQADSFARTRTYKRVLEYRPNGSLMSPASALAEVFSRKKKQRLRFQKDFYRMEKERYTDTRYTPELVAELTRLEGDTLAHFMNLYPMPYDYARVASDLEIKMWIRGNFKDWMAKGRPLMVRKEE